MFLMILAASATFFFYPKIRAWSDSGSSTEKALRHLADFRPDLVDSLDAEVLKRPEFAEILRRRDHIAMFKQQLMERIEASNPYLSKLSIGPKVERNVTLMKAREDGVIFVIGQQVPDNAPWSRFGPTGIREMALWKTDKVAALLDGAGNRYALALYALSAGSTGIARDLFRDLKGTQFEGQAADYLRQLNETQ